MFRYLYWAHTPGPIQVESHQVGYRRNRNTSVIGMVSSQSLLVLLTAFAVLSPTLSFYYKLHKSNYKKSIIVNARVAKAEEETQDSVVDKDDPKITIPFKGSARVLIHLLILVCQLPNSDYSITH